MRTRLVVLVVLGAGGMAVAAPDGGAPAKTTRVYDAAQCTERVALFRQRAADAAARLDESRMLASVAPLSSTIDSGLSAPDVTVEMAPAPGTSASDCGDWITIVEVRGKTPTKFSGAKRDARTVAKVKQLLRSGDRLGVVLNRDQPLASTLPLLTELAKLGPMAMKVVTTAAPYPVTVTDAPPWALEKYRAIVDARQVAEAAAPSAAEADAKRAAVSRMAALTGAGLKEAAGTCAAHQSASDKALGNGDRRAIPAAIAREYPAAAATCVCSNMDVDAYELFTVASLVMFAPLLTQGWLELRMVPASSSTTHTLTVTTVSDLVQSLAALSLDDRRAGVVLQPAAGTASQCKRP